MNGHPAIAYIVAQQMLEQRREAASQHRKAESAPKSRSLKLGRYCLTLSKAPRPV